jgi:hypothetical protein
MKLDLLEKSRIVSQAPDERNYHSKKNTCNALPIKQFFTSFYLEQVQKKGKNISCFHPINFHFLIKVEVLL